MQPTAYTSQHYIALKSLFFSHIHTQPNYYLLQLHSFIQKYPYHHRIASHRIVFRNSHRVIVDIHTRQATNMTSGCYDSYNTNTQAVPTSGSSTSRSYWSSSSRSLPLPSPLVVVRSIIESLRNSPSIPHTQSFFLKLFKYMYFAPLCYDFFQHFYSVVFFSLSLFLPIFFSSHSLDHRQLCHVF